MKDAGMNDLQTAVEAAAKALLESGFRVTVRAVWKWLTDHHGSAPSFRDLAPVVEAWKRKHRASPAVAKLVKSYRELDVERQTEFRDRAGLVNNPQRE